ncbi:hypothetical protein B0H12DRAFT_1179422 [Mycena haematopus]|nr:hypothetical protein B0H12DRAFT_1179422 [Mycena haematopus]
MAQPVSLNTEDISSRSSNRRPHKRSRKTKSSRLNSDDVLPASAHILGLPFELIAETLVCTASPMAVLAVARCNKYLCNTLLRPESEFIWRSVRRNCLPEPLPDPLPFLSEAGFAAMVFDPGHCASCGTMTYNMFSSWSLRVRFCSRPECKATWAKKNTLAITNFAILTRNVRKALTWIPLAESPACFSGEDHSQTWPDAKKVYLASTMDAALAEYEVENATIVDARHADEVARSPLKMKFYVTLYNWKRKRLQLERQVKADNKTFGMDLAAKEGYVYAELLNGSATYQNLLTHRTKNLEFITRLDYDLVAAKIEAEMISVQDRQRRRTNEATIRANTKQVERHYQRLVLASRSKVPADPWPSLAAFRAMPILGLLQSRSGLMSAPDVRAKKVPGVARELQDETLASQLLASEMRSWRKTAEAQLGATLGIPEWRTARSNRLHPVARLTARWTCGKCGEVARAYKWDGCLDYQGVCKHECKKGKGSLWKAENFVKADKPINAMTKLVKLCGIDAEDPGSFKALKDIGPRVLCLSCPAAIVMCPSSVPGHSYRHEDMDMSLLISENAHALVVFPIQQDLAKELMEPNDVKVKQTQKTWKFGCRHCEQRVPKVEGKKKATEPGKTDEKKVEGQMQGDDKSAEEQPEGKTEPVQKKENPIKKPKRFDFNGLRSHLKEKHSIALPSDEDFYHVRTH